MKIKGWDLSFFSSGEWQAADERLKDLEKIASPIGHKYPAFVPGRKQLFAALRAIPAAEVRCVIVGQDPYPTTGHATGLAFDVSPDIGYDDLPPTSQRFLEEYSRDLGLSRPPDGNISEWSSRGVLLWNAIPSCRVGHSLSHDWPEWALLTGEIVRTLAKKGIVFALLGQVARRYSGLISDTNNAVVVTSHPSPRGAMASKTPFVGSRLFSTINDKLNDLALEPIDWRLRHEQKHQGSSGKG